MSFTYDTTTNLGKVRNLIGDSVDSGHQLEDADINAFLSMTSNDLYKSASLCLYRISASKALLAKRKQAGNYSEDLTAIAREVREVAKLYQTMAESIPAEAQAEVITTDFSYREVLLNKVLRDEND